MDTLRKEIEDEIKRTRLDKTRLYELILKIVDSSSTGGPPGPPGERGLCGPIGAPGLKGDDGAGCECKCVSKVVSPVPVKEKATNVTTGKKSTVTKNKVVTTA